MSVFRQSLLILGGSLVTGLALGFFRYDDGCLEVEHRVLVATLNALMIFGGAAAFAPIALSRTGGSTLRFSGFALLGGLAAGGGATLLSIALIQPLVAPEPLRIADYVYVFFVPGLLIFLAVVHMLRLQARNREFARALAEFQRTPSSPTRDDSSSVPEELVIREEGETYTLPTRRILYISGSRKKSVVHTDERDYETNLLLKDVLDRLPAGFLRVHKSYAVDLSRVAGVEYQFGGTYQLTLGDEDDTTLPVGRRYLSELRARLQKN